MAPSFGALFVRPDSGSSLLPVGAAWMMKAEITQSSLPGISRKWCWRLGATQLGLLDKTLNRASLCGLLSYSIDWVSWAKNQLEAYTTLWSSLTIPTASLPILSQGHLDWRERTVIPTTQWKGVEPGGTADAKVKIQLAGMTNQGHHDKKKRWGESFEHVYFYEDMYSGYVKVFCKRSQDRVGSVPQGVRLHIQCGRKMLFLLHTSLCGLLALC